MPPKKNLKKENIQDVLNKYCGGTKSCKLNSRMPKNLKGGAYNDELDDIQNQLDIISQTDYEKLPTWERSQFYEALKGIEQQLLDLSEKYPEDDFVTGVRLQEVRDLQKKVAPKVKKLPPLPAIPKKILDEEKEFSKFKNKDYIPSNKQTISHPNSYGMQPIKKKDDFLANMQEGELFDLFKTRLVPKKKAAPKYFKKPLIQSLPKDFKLPSKGKKKGPKEKVLPKDRKFHYIDENWKINSSVFKGTPRQAALKAFNKFGGDEREVEKIVRMVDITPGYNEKIFTYVAKKRKLDDDEKKFYETGINKYGKQVKLPVFTPSYITEILAIK